MQKREAKKERCTRKDLEGYTETFDTRTHRGEEIDTLYYTYNGESKGERRGCKRKNYKYPERAKKLETAK